jgi:hypothetical protein
MKIRLDTLDWLCEKKIYSLIFYTGWGINYYTLFNFKKNNLSNMKILISCIDAS